MNLLIIVLSAMLELVPSGQAWLEPLQKRDSILVADQIDYGFELKGLENGTTLGLQDFSLISNDTLTLVRNWQIDTVKKSKNSVDIRASIRLAPFEEGSYELPPLMVLRRSADGELIDTLVFEPAQLEVYSMPVDTATFVIHDIKPQMQYPITFMEILPWLLGLLVLAALIWLAIKLIKKYGKKNGTQIEGPKESPYIVALRQLDRYRSNTHWEADKQKAFYSGITDALKSYIDAQFGIDAPEMTTAELFTQLKECKELTPELYQESKELFELADYVKFAKYIAEEEQNTKALPTAIRFVMNTYQTTLEEEQSQGDVL